MDTQFTSQPQGFSGCDVNGAKALSFLRLASIRLMLRKLCNPA
jgi:hypothetical protein